MSVKEGAFLITVITMVVACFLHIHDASIMPSLSSCRAFSSVSAVLQSALVSTSTLSMHLPQISDAPAMASRTVSKIFAGFDPSPFVQGARTLRSCPIDSALRRANQSSATAPRIPRYLQHLFIDVEALYTDPPDLNRDYLFCFTPLISGRP